MNSQRFPSLLFLKLLVLVFPAILLISCFEGATGPVGPAGTTGTTGPAGASGAQVTVASGYLYSTTMNANGYWEITTSVLTAPLVSVYVRANTGQVWWTPAYYVESNGNVRILNNQATGSVVATNLTNYEYRVVYAVF
jgi:hypothetical protein